MFLKALSALSALSVGQESQGLDQNAVPAKAEMKKANMILPIIKYPHPVLGIPCPSVSEITIEAGQLALDMVETMQSAGLVGLAAPQIGKTINLMVADVRRSKRPSRLYVEGKEMPVESFMPLILFNAEITPDESRRELGFEGCGSVPGIRVEIERPASTRVRGLTEKGERVDFECSGLLARVIQHERDHLCGKLFTDRMSPETLASVQEQLRYLETKAATLNVFAGVFSAEQGSFAEGKTSVWDYSDSGHFASLWASLENGQVRAASQVLIIWSKTPFDESLSPVNTSEHVSPLHWAACAVKKCSQIQVCVLDLNPTAHRSQYLYEHYLFCEKRRLPWLRVIQAAHFFGNENTNGEFQPDTSLVEIETLKGRFFPQLEPRRGFVEAGHFVDRIRNELTSPQNAENRHAISNIIGPMILRSGCPLSGETSGVVFVKNGKKADFPAVVRGTVSHRCALNCILRAAGLLCAEISEDKTATQTPEEFTRWLAFDLECADAGLNPTDLRITLVDDQWQQGWLAWIKEGLGATPVGFQVSPDPDLLLRLLHDANSEPRNFSLSLDVLQNERKGHKQDILLLDLRLFTSNPTAEREFLIALGAILTPLSATEKLKLDKQSIRQDLAVVSRRLEVLAGSTTDLSSEEHARYVTLLPRLLAQQDFSLPIIIFSSTGQRDVVKQFDKFPNIITDFSKPRHFQGADENVVPHTEDHLRQSMARAIQLLRGRELVQQIQSRPLAMLEKARKRCVGYSHFELYFDESGKSAFPNFRCAALLIGYGGGGDKDTYDWDAKLMHQRMEAEQINLWQEDEVFLEDNYNRDPSKQWEIIESPLADIIGERPVIPFVISRTPSSTEPPHELDLAHPDALDNALFDLLEIILEIGLVDVLPAICGDLTKLSLHIYGACRLQTIILEAKSESSAKTEAMQKWDVLRNKYGFQKDAHWHDLRVKFERGKWCFLYRSLRKDSFLPMLARCFGNRISSKHTGQLRKAVKSVIGAQLPKGQPPSEEVRHQHYICDRLAYFSKVPHDNGDTVDLDRLRDWPPINESSPGFLGRRNNSLLGLVDCGRQLDVENVPLALVLGQSVLDCEGIFPETIASRLQAIIPKLSAESFNELCNLMADISEFSKGSALAADKFRGKQKITSRQVQSAQRNEFRGTKREKTFSQPHAHLKSSQLPASALRDLEEAMDRPTMPSQREAQSGDCHGVGTTTLNLGRGNELELLIRHIDTGASEQEIMQEIETAVRNIAKVNVRAKVIRNKTSGIPYAFVKFRDFHELTDAREKIGGSIKLFGRMFAMETVS